MLKPRQAFGKALAHDVREILVEREGRRHLEVGKEILAFRKRHVAALGDAHRVPQRVGKILEGLRHLVRRLQKKLTAVVSQPLGIAHRFAGTDAQQDVVRVRVGFAQVVHIVRADEREVQIARNRRHTAVDDALIFDAVPLHLEEEVARTQDVAVRARGLHRFALLLM